MHLDTNDVRFDSLGTCVRIVRQENATERPYTNNIRPFARSMESSVAQRSCTCCAFCGHNASCQALLLWDLVAVERDGIFDSCKRFKAIEAY